MPLSRELTGLEEIVSVVITWFQDQDEDISQLDDQVKFLPNGDVDVQATYEEIMKVGGCSDEQSREQTAAQLARIEAWKKDEWYYVCCSLAIKLAATEIVTRKQLSRQNWGDFESYSVESFAGEERQKEIESDLLNEAFVGLQDRGFDITLEELQQVQVLYNDNWKPNDEDPGKLAKPLEKLPERYLILGKEGMPKVYCDFMYTSEDRYSETKGGEIVGVCESCGVCLPLSECGNILNHNYGCIVLGDYHQGNLAE